MLADLTRLPGHLVRACLTGWYIVNISVSGGKEDSRQHGQGYRGPATVLLTALLGKVRESKN